MVISASFANAKLKFQVNPNMLINLKIRLFTLWPISQCSLFHVLRNLWFSDVFKGGIEKEHRVDRSILL